eukprot:1738090-Prymnesium_polylepis.1
MNDERRMCMLYWLRLSSGVSRRGTAARSRSRCRHTTHDTKANAARATLLRCLKRSLGRRQGRRHSAPPSHRSRLGRHAHAVGVGAERLSALLRLLTRVTGHAMRRPHSPADSAAPVHAGHVFT